MRVAVLGAGVIGVTTAWYLVRQGLEVTVVDRQPGPGLETSFANGGQISVSHAEPWANPRAPWQILKWLFQEESPLLWRLRADADQWAWGVQFLRQCGSVRTRENIRALVELGIYSRLQLQNLRHELALAYEQRTQGILHIYANPVQFRHACDQARWMRQFGCERHPVEAAEVLRIEPALASAELPLCGGTYTQADESGDAYLFTRELAAHAQRQGVRFRYDCPVVRLQRSGERVAHVELVGGERLEADAYVMACGSYSAPLLASADIRLPIYPAKGYSATFDSQALCVSWPTTSLTDDEHKLVFSRLGDRLRVAGTAEFSGFDLTLNARRCEAIRRRAARLFPSLRQVQEVEYWAGLRPATPGNVPLVGASELSNLWLNTGHGTLGWTLACGSAGVLAAMITGMPSAIPTSPYSGRR